MDKQSVFENPHGVDAKNILNTENAEVIHKALKPGQSLKRHITPVDAFFYILEGAGVIEVGDEQQEVGVDTLVLSPKGTPHVLRNTGRKSSDSLWSRRQNRRNPQFSCF